MMAGPYPVVDVLLLVGSVAPIALYFLFLGLVNSHARPYLTTSRSDFISLTVFLMPVLMWPIPVFAQSGMWWLLATGVFLAGLVFFWMLPSPRDGLVMYNISEARCTKLLKDAIHHLGWAGRWNDQNWQAEHGQMTIVVRGFALLRNATIHIESNSQDSDEKIAALQAELNDRLQAVSQLPSTMGTCLVVIGVALMIIPIWMVNRHIDDLVDAMSHLFG